MRKFYFLLFFLLSASFAFSENKPVTRAQFARLLNESSLLSGLPDVATLERFSDVPITHPNLGAIVTCVKKGILEGFPGPTFKPEGVITRYELAIILEKLVTAIEKLYSASFHVFETSVSISDVPKDHWAFTQVQKLVQYHIVALDSGGAFRGKSPATVSEVEQTLTQIKKQTILLKDSKAEKKDVHKTSTHTTGCISGNCINGSGTYVFSSGTRYAGEFNNGKQEGEGMSYYANGDTYEGEWKQGKMEGQGTYTWANKTKYVGSWKNGNREGYGTLYNSDGSIAFQGQWKEGKKVETVVSKDTKKDEKPHELDMDELLKKGIYDTHDSPVNTVDFTPFDKPEHSTKKKNTKAETNTNKVTVKNEIYCNALFVFNGADGYVKTAIAGTFYFSINKEKEYTSPAKIHDPPGSGNTLSVYFDNPYSAKAIGRATSNASSKAKVFYCIGAHK